MKLKIITVVIVILLLVAMSVPVYADTTIPDIPSEQQTYWVVYGGNHYDFMYLTSNNPITATTNGQSLKVKGYSHYYYYNDGWKYRSGGQYENSFGIGSGGIYQSNHDIAYEDGSGFFFLRPKVLHQTMKETDSGTILRNFSAGLIPIIGCLILVISLQKGWEFLRTQLTS